jgi:alpha-beta hydrolase superfamily lysophospholipase
MRYVKSKIPDCIALSKNKSNLKLGKFDSNTTNDDIETYKQAYKRHCRKLNSDYTNDVFIDDDGKAWTITRRTDKRRDKTCFYVPGNNDYFYIKRMSDQLFDAGYNFYAISMPNFGFASNVDETDFSTFESVSGLYKYIDYACLFYNIKTIDIMFGHSTGGLIATCYTDYKNSYEPFVKRLVLSSPFLNSAYVNFISLPRMLPPCLNVSFSKGQINNTVCTEINELVCNPKYKSMYEVSIFVKWLRAVSTEHSNIQHGCVDAKCPVDIIHSNKSALNAWTNSADNSLDIKDIQTYGKRISSQPIKFHEIPDSIHLCFLRVENICALLNICN